MEGAAHRRWDTSSQSSFRTSVSTVGDIGGNEDIEEVEETSPRPVDDRVFVAVPEDVKHGKSTLLWALENLAKDDGARVVVAHVHCPPQMIPMMGAKFHYTTVNRQQVSDHRRTVRAEADARLDAYVLMCRKLKVSCEKIIIEKDNVADGLEEFVALHGMAKLVMGAAADKHYSKKMKTPKSKTALRLIEAVAPSCKIWFTCKGNLICTREANTTVPAIHPSPAHTVASLSASSSISSKTRSVRSHHSQSEASSFNGSPRRDAGWSRTEVAQYPVTSTPSRLHEPFDLDINGMPQVTPRASIDSWDEFGRRSRRSWYSPSINDDAVTISGSATRHQMVDPNDANFSSPYNLEKPGSDADIYDRLAEALNEAQISKTEAYEESIKRRRIEQDMISAIQKVKELDNICQHEFRQRQTLDETLKRKSDEIEEMKRERDAISNELHDLKEQKFVLEQRVTEMTRVIKDHEEKMAANKYLLQVMQTENEKLQQERDAAVATAEVLHQRISDQRVLAPLTAEALNTEFSYSELEAATRDFDQALKIGEGGFGSVYRGFLRNTTVAVKLLHPESLQGQSEFNQEVAILSRVRHPNLVTLIGSCPEAFGLVYEFLPNGSLEDRLACTDNTPPLTWQVRTKIIYEMCSALSFLHSSKPHPVVHGDLKPANILLDANLVSKLGDFGICRLLIQSTTSTMRPYHTATPKGTFAYMDPEFLSTGELTPGSDVYSLGIIILRLLTGRQPQNIAEAVEDAMDREELHAILDPTAGDWPFVQANQLAHIGLRCAEMSRRRRPDLAGEVWKVVEPLMKAASLSLSLTLGRPPPPDDAHAPSYFLCPIFQEVMSDPHVAADGFTYEAEAVRGWFDSGHDTSPMTNLKLPHRELTPNRALRSAILEWQQQQQ